jgi:hypothetical protein
MVGKTNLIEDVDWIQPAVTALDKVNMDLLE